MIKTFSSFLQAIVWDKSLAGPIGLVANYRLLLEHEVIKMYPITGGELPSTNVANIIFITRPHLDLMNLIAENVHRYQNQKQKKNKNIFCTTYQQQFSHHIFRESEKRTKKQFHIFFVPHMSLFCKTKLENHGVYGNFTWVEEFKCDLFPFDNDLVSMELTGAFSEYNLSNDPTCLYRVALAIQNMQKLYGKIPRVSGKGTAAKQVHELMKRLQREEDEDYDDDVQQSNSMQSPLIEHLVLIDRSVDLLSPLATQLTYEGLIDEIFGINNSAF